MYRKCEGVPKDTGKAVEWFQKAAGQGDTGAQFVLGFMYWTGDGVIRNRKKACELWHTAGELGNGGAIDAYNQKCAK
jgi:TPR repeat protein